MVSLPSLYPAFALRLVSSHRYSSAAVYDGIGSKSVSIEARCKKGLRSAQTTYLCKLKFTTQACPLLNSFPISQLFIPFFMAQLQGKAFHQHV